MTYINHMIKEINCKIVYYGPGLCGKTANLQYIFGRTKDEKKGKMISLETETDRTLFFDFLPIDLGEVGGFKVRFHLYTVPGQVFYDASRKLVLRGADGVVFVADSQPARHDANLESLENLEENLGAMGRKLDDVPYVLQYNKRDLPDIMTPEEMSKELDRHGATVMLASALTGDGVFDTLKTLSKKVLVKIKNEQAAAAG
jgi:signal recognition particle receptor subunit beta